MSGLLSPKFRYSAFLITAVIFGLYMAVSAFFHEQFRYETAILTVVPVISGSWYFGVWGGISMTVIIILTRTALRASAGESFQALITDPVIILGGLAMILISVIVGRLATIMRERQIAFHKLESYERERQAQLKFLELLNGVTRKALEADNLESTLKILVEKIGRLFEADDCFFSYWDEGRGVPVPAVAFGSMNDIFPFMNFEQGDITLAASVLKAGRSIGVPDTGNSQHIESKISAVFPSRSMLGLPLIVNDRKVGALLLGYNISRSFDHDDITRAEMTAEQVALVLSKSQLLEEERRQVKQLTTLHEVARVATQVDNENSLIELVTDIIGKNLFPDNFGILLLGEKGEFLHPHASYRFFSPNKIVAKKVRMGEGVTGRVASTRRPQLIGNVRKLKHYLDVDERTISELCVPILFKDQLLGVINAESTKRNAFNADDERLLVTLAGQLATAIEQIRRSQAERKWLDQLAHSNELIYSFTHITTRVEKALTSEEIIQTFGRELENMRLTCILAVYDKASEMFETKYTSLDTNRLARLEKRTGGSLIRHTFHLEQYINSMPSREYLLQPVIVTDPADEVKLLFLNDRYKRFSKILEWVGVNQHVEVFRLPLVFEENLLGVLWVWGEGITRADLPILSTFSKQISASLERARLFKEVQELALTDPLTGLSNRRSLFEVGRIEFLRSIRMNRPFCCMMLDLDHFKQVNDNYGHQTGDLVLQEFATRCKNSVREVDLVGRYGGEEIIILLPETELKTAQMVAERLRKAIADKPVKNASLELHLTVSIGVAQKDENTLELETLLARADQAMYIAKHKGRNRVAVSI